ncbi:MAG: hypothetical protein KY452_08500 [Actinobacteria bacterium]|nr:hypothetical protein [Actinomycetota bacterium]
MLVLMAVAMTMLLGVVALVVDLAQLRTDRKINKTVTDVSVRAGLGVLDLGPWAGVCRARDYLMTNKALSAFDSGSETWSKPTIPLTSLSSSPCANPTAAPYTDLCLASAPGVPDPSTWARLTATAGGGRFTIEIQSGYLMPDARFAEDVIAVADIGDPEKASCDNLMVIVTERRTPFFAGVIGAGGDKTTTTRSVGRLSDLRAEEYSPALLLLEREGCDVLNVNSNNSRVFAQPYKEYPGVIQVDSAGSGTCASNQAILNGAATSGGPSIMACSANSTVAGCITTANGSLRPTAGIGTNLSRIGMYARNFTHPSGDYLTSGAGTYGDTRAVRASRSGRTPLDQVYRDNVVALDADAKAVLTGNGGMPPGCTAIVDSACTGNGRTWLVLQPADCTTWAVFFAVPGRTAAQNIWFNCDLNISTTSLALTALDSYIVVTGQLNVTNTFTIDDPRTVYVGGRSTGNKIGLEVGNGGNLNINNKQPTGLCPAPDATTEATTMVVGDGLLNLANGQTHLCQTFVFAANGYGKVPATDGTAPCTCGYTGKLSVSSGAVVDWSAPNLISGRRPTAAEIATTHRFENLGLWTEAGGAQSMSGGGSSQMSGVFFLGNADAFTLTGNSGANVYLSAQFITRRMKVTGGATVNLVLDPFDSVPVVIYDMVLVR